MTTEIALCKELKQTEISLHAREKQIRTPSYVDSGVLSVGWDNE